MKIERGGDCDENTLCTCSKMSKTSHSHALIALIFQSDHFPSQFSQWVHTVSPSHYNVPHLHLFQPHRPPPWLPQVEAILCMLLKQNSTDLYLQ